MDEEIKVHLDAIAELAKGKKTGYLFLMTTEMLLRCKGKSLLSKQWRLFLKQ